MTAPQPVSNRALLAWTGLAVAAVVVLLAVIGWAGSRPFTESPTRPLPAPPAGPAPLTPVVLTAVPMHGWGPR